MAPDSARNLVHRVAPQPVFVGREDAIAILAEALSAARRGEPQLVVVEGPPGIGKTSYVRHALEALEPSHVEFVTASEHERLVSFALIGRLLAGLERRGGRSASHRVLDARDDATEVGGLLLGSLGSEQNQQTTIVVDDAQWIDTPSLLALAFALRRLETERILVIVSTRGPVDRDDVLGRLVEDRGARHVVLDPLTADDVELLARRHGIPLNRAAATRLCRHTGGLPVHVAALLEELDPGALMDTRSPLPAPRSFATVVLQRLASAPPGVEAVVTAAAVVGDRASVAVVTAVAATHDPMAMIDLAVDLRMLEYRREFVGHELRFVHDLVHAAVLGALAPGRRAELHRRAAQHLDGVAALEHRAAGTVVPEERLAGELQACAAAEIERGEIDVGVAHMLEAARLHPDAATARSWRLDALGALAWGGALTSATQLAADLRSDMTTDDPRVWYLRGHFALLADQRDEAEQLLLAGWDRCDPVADPAIAGLLAARLAQLYVIFGPERRPGDAVLWAERSLRLTPHDITHVPAPNGMVLVSLALAGRADEALARALPDADTAVALARGVRRDTMANGFDEVLGRGIVKLWTDDIAGARADLARVISPAGSCRASLITRLWGLGYLADAEFRAGYWDDAVADAEFAVALAGDSGHRWMLGMLHSVGALPAAARGEWEAADAHVHAARVAAAATASTVSVVYAAGAATALAVARGDHAAVIAATEPLMALDPARGAREPGVLDWFAARIEALARTGRLDDAAALADEALDLATQRRRKSAIASVRCSLGVLHSIAGDRMHAEEEFTRAGDELATLEVPFVAARTQLAYGAHLRRVGQRRTAATRLGAALEVFARLRARPYAELAESELRGCGLTPRRRDAGAVHLTPREHAVARLVADGLSNPEIAQRLFLSVKTVEYHLGNAFTKLGVRNRAQLAAQMTAAPNAPKN